MVVLYQDDWYIFTINDNFLTVSSDVVLQTSINL